jgi:single-strand DNA-binding protein
MARSLNRATILGNVGKDPELRTTQSGISVCRLNVATSDSYKGKNGEWQETTEWHSIVLWGDLADRYSKNIKKGSKVYIEGRIQTRSYEKDGIVRYVTEVNANRLIILDPKTDSASHIDSDEKDETRYTTAEEPEDDDIPF